MFRILHLEDCSNDALLIENAIQREGIDVKFIPIKNRAEFLSAFEQGQFDLILADSGVPGLEGISALKMVRHKYPHVGFICLSGQQNPAYIKASFDAGATDYVSKDDMPKLIETLRREVERRVTKS